MKRRPAEPASHPCVPHPHARLPRLHLVLAVVLLSGCSLFRGTAQRGGLPSDLLPGAPPAAKRIEVAVQRGVQYLLGRQSREGYWCGVLHNDSSVTGLYILLANYTRNVDPARQAKAVRYLLDEQGQDGGWEQYPGSGGSLDVTLVNHTALCVAGVDPESPPLLRSHAFVDERGGLGHANFFTKILLGMFGQLPWRQLPWISCRLIESPDIIYRQGFPRTILIPYMLLYENRMVLDLPPFFASPPESGTSEASGNALRQEKSPTAYLDRLKADENRERCIQWILERQETDGCWAGIVQVTAFSCMALASCRNPAFEPLIARGVRSIEAWQVETETTIQQPFSVGPVMDTSFSIVALRRAGVPGRHPSIRKAAAWLVGRQSRLRGDWAYANPETCPGGWAFQFHNTWYPDVDDTSMVLHALAHLEPAVLEPFYPSVDAGLEWLLSMQNRDGGFPVWDRNNWRIFNVLKSVFDVGDYSHADVTARTLQALHRIGRLERYAHRTDMETAMDRAFRFLLREGKHDGSWYGRWGANYTYGTGQVLQALCLPESPARTSVTRKATDWLYGVQNADGGWGESLESYETGTFVPGDSTVAQTGSVAMGLLASSEGLDPRFWQALEYVLRSQEEDGSWQDRLFYAVNVPREWYGRYELLSSQAALILLASYLESVGES